MFRFFVSRDFIKATVKLTGIPGQKINLVIGESISPNGEDIYIILLTGYGVSHKFLSKKLMFSNALLLLTM